MNRRNFLRRVLAAAAVAAVPDLTPPEDKERKTYHFFGSGISEGPRGIVVCRTNSFADMPNSLRYTTEKSDILEAFEMVLNTTASTRNDRYSEFWHRTHTMGRDFKMISGDFEL
jgi:hypothetical protein